MTPKLRWGLWGAWAGGPGPGPGPGGLGRGAWAWTRGPRPGGYGWTYGCTDVRTDGQNIPCILQNIAPLGPLPKKEGGGGGEKKKKTSCYIATKSHDLGPNF